MKFIKSCLLFFMHADYGWNSIHADVSEFCKHCDTININTWVGPLPETKNENKYIITLEDYVSKWPEAAAILSKEATCVAGFLLETFCRYAYGWPKTVLSDKMGGELD